MVTLRDVANAAGVSPATASRALSHPSIVTPVRRARVERAAAELGYRRVDTTPPPRRVGLVVPDLHNPYFSGITKGIQHRVRIAGLSLLIADSDEDPHLEVELVREMAPQVDAIVLCSPRMPGHMLTGSRVDPPIVLVNRQAADVPSVVVDNGSGIRQAVRHLHALGHRRIAYVGGKHGSWSEGNAAPPWSRRPPSSGSKPSTWATSRQRSPVAWPRATWSRPASASGRRTQRPDVRRHPRPPAPARHRRP